MMEIRFMWFIVAGKTSYETLSTRETKVHTDSPISSRHFSELNTIYMKLKFIDIFESNKSKWSAEFDW